MAIEFLSLIVNEEMNNLKKNLEMDNQKEKVNLINDKGDVLFPIKRQYDEIYVLFEDYRFNEQYYEWVSLLDIHTEKNKILKTSFSKALLILHELCDMEEFSGMIAFNDETLLNISHPMVIYEILNNEKLFEKLNKEKFKFIIYQFKDPKIKPEIVEKYKDAFGLLLALLKKDLIREAKAQINIEYIQHDDSIDSIEDIKSSYIEISKNVNIDSLLIPLQSAHKGIFIPVFSAIAINSKGKGNNLFGTISGNIEHKFWESSDHKVCTGNFDNRTLRGWYTLSKINVKSMWFQPFVSEYHIEQAKAAHYWTKTLIEDFLNKTKEKGE